MLSFDTRMSAETMRYLVKLARDGRLSLLVPSISAKTVLATNFAMVDVHIDWEKHIHVIIPSFAAARKERKYGPGLYRSFSRVGILHEESRSGRNSSLVWKNYFSELDSFVTSKPEIWTNKPLAAENMPVSTNLKPFELHIVSSHSLVHLKAILPPSLEPVVHFHGKLNTTALHKLISTMVRAPASRFSGGHS